MVGSGAAPECIARVSKPVGGFLGVVSETSDEVAIIALPTGRRLDVIVLELNPCHESSPNNRENSILGHLFITTRIPAASALAAAS